MEALVWDLTLARLVEKLVLPILGKRVDFLKRLPFFLGTLFMTAAMNVAIATGNKDKVPDDVSGKKLGILIRGTLIAVNHANLTDNYTLLRDLGSFEFSYRNSASTLADLFKPFRVNDINLEETVLEDPILIKKPVIEEGGILSLVGFTRIGQKEVVFDLKYKYELGFWKIMSISLSTRPANLKTSRVSEKN